MPLSTLEMSITMVMISSCKCKICYNTLRKEFFNSRQMHQQLTMTDMHLLTGWRRPDALCLIFSCSTLCFYLIGYWWTIYIWEGAPKAELYANITPFLEIVDIFLFIWEQPSLNNLCSGKLIYTMIISYFDF